MAAMRTKQVPGGLRRTCRILRPDGAIRWVHHRAAPLRTAAGEVFRIVGTAEDVTEHRQLEEQLRQSQKMDAVGQLAGGIAHDVNNIMTVIQGHGSLLLDQLAAILRAQSVREVVLAADRAANVTRQLLTFSRQQVMQPRALDLNEVVTNLAGMLRRAAGPQVDVRITCGRSRLVTRADSGMLEQAVLNLVINARDAMPDGGSVLSRPATAFSMKGTRAVSTMSGPDGMCGCGSRTAAPGSRRSIGRTSSNRSSRRRRPARAPDSAWRRSSGSSSSTAAQSR